MKFDPSKRRTVVADRIHLVDDSGILRLFMWSGHNQTNIEFRDENCPFRLAFLVAGHPRDIGVISVQDEKETPRLVMTCSGAGDAGIEMRTGICRDAMACDSILDEDPRVTVCDRGRRVVFSTCEEDVIMRGRVVTAMLEREQNADKK